MLGNMNHLLLQTSLSVYRYSVLQAIAADCKRVTVLKYFLEALCGQEEPLLAFKGGKYISMAAPSTSKESTENKTQTQELVQKQTFY